MVALNNPNRLNMRSPEEDNEGLSLHRREGALKDNIRTKTPMNLQ
jgi:hypothetical protein